MRLQIKPGLRTVWRSDDTVQIGLDPERGTVLEGLTPSDRALVDHLATGLDDSAVTGPGPQAERGRRLVRLLTESDVLVARRAGRAVLAQVARDAQRLSPDAAVWGVVHRDAGDGWELVAARRQRAVEVRGAGRTATAIATTLVAAGVGSVRLLDERRVAAADVGPAGPAWADVGSPASQAARRAGERLRPAADDLRDAAPRGTDLVVLVRSAVADSVETGALVVAGVPHLSVVVRERGLLVGPLVVPGRSACLRCLDLGRADRDPAWPRVLAQLAGRRAPRAAEESASALLGGSLAALQALCHLDGRTRPAALGATLEVELPDGLVSRRSWPAHPSCGCIWGVPAGHRERSGATDVTMEE